MKEKRNPVTEKIMSERFGKDSILSLATAVEGIPSVRSVNAYYQDGAFYVITYAKSNKIKQIGINPTVGISGEWFTAHGIGENLGYIYKEENLKIAEKLKAAFCEWYDNGHNDYSDPNTCILCIRLTDGVLFSNGIKYEIDFTV